MTYYCHFKINHIFTYDTLFFYLKVKIEIVNKIIVYRLSKN